MSGLPSTALAFGKIPAHGDFVRAGTHCAAVDDLDEWLQEGLRELKRQPSPSDAEGPPTPLHLIYAAPHLQDVLVGSLVMSRDRVGRRYPFLVARAVDRSALDPREVPFWPIIWCDLLAATATLATRAIASLDANQVAACLETLPPVRDPGDRTLLRDHQAMLQATTTGAFWESVWGHSDASEKYALLMRLLDTVRPALGAAPPECALAFPLPRNGSLVATEAVWLEAVWRLWPRRAELPVVAWPAGGPPGRLLVFPNGPLRSGAGTVLGAALNPHHVVELDAPMARPTDAVLALPPRYGRLLEHPELPLSALLNGL